MGDAEQALRYRSVYDKDSRRRNGWIVAQTRLFTVNKSILTVGYDHLSSQFLFWDFFEDRSAPLSVGADTCDAEPALRYRFVLTGIPACANPKKPQAANFNTLLMYFVAIWSQFSERGELCSSF